MWKITLMPRAQKFLFKLEKKQAKQIMKKISSTIKNPPKHFVELVNSPYSKLRVGDYWVIAVLDPPNKLVEIWGIGHRRNIYKQL